MTTNDSAENVPSVTTDVELEHAPDVVWELFADADRLARWLGAGSAIDLRVGGAVVTPDPVSGRPKRGRVERVEAGRSLTLTWWDADDGSGQPTDDREVSLVRFDLEPASAGTTRLTVTETALTPPAVGRASATAGPTSSQRAAGAGSPAPARCGAGLWAWRLAILGVALSLQPVR